ncbi:MAG: helix-turn-helix transcriptional regulator [Tistlia sp.]|uniref:helix-turn-helix domain-containing protein n=1 Tax=Tistlia sp. TaxID=3057121 RepID=UPI0034A46ADB
MSDRPSPDPFPANLGQLCSYHPSIAEACRKLGFNRQQFNKYLGGTSRPSRHNMRRICDFFGVTESEMLLEPERFAELVSLRRRPLENGPLREPLRHLEALYRESGSLDRYHGFYYRYFYSFGYPGQIIKSLVQIFGHQGLTYWKNIEVTRSRDGHSDVSKYLGAALLLAERILVIEYETMLRNSVTQVMLFPSYSSRIDQLIGVQTGGPVRRGRKPAASRVLLEFIGREVDLRRALAGADIFEESEIEPRIRALIGNAIPEGDYVLEVDEV